MRMEERRAVDALSNRLVEQTVVLPIERSKENLDRGAARTLAAYRNVETRLQLVPCQSQ